jgi:UDP-N-acetylglucosamine pyrophosphorylase
MPHISSAHVSWAASSGLSAGRWYNTNNIWIDLRALADLQATDPAAPDLPLIINHKTVDPRNPERFQRYRKRLVRPSPSISSMCSAVHPIMRESPCLAPGSTT